MWRSVEELRASGYTGLVTVRDSRPNGKCVYAMSAGEVYDTFVNCEFNESMPDHLLTIQGNLYLSDTGLKLTYSCEPNLRFREAVTEPYGKYAEGLMAIGLLKKFLFPSSYDDLMELVELYPDAWVIEFSAYRVPVGVIPHRNTVIWELRNF